MSVTASIDRRRKWTPEIRHFVRVNYYRTLTVRSLADKVNAQFGTSFTRKSILQFAYNNGFTKKKIIIEKPLYSEIINGDGYTYIKICMTGKKNQKWKVKHRWVWETANGKIPRGMDVIFLDNNRQNCELNNLAMISKEEKVKLTQYGLRSDNRDITLAGIAIVKHSIAIHRALEKQLGARKHKNFNNSNSAKKRRRRLRTMEMLHSVDNITKMGEKTL